MIKLIIGQPGSGKSLSIIKTLIDSKHLSFVNFQTKKSPLIKRLKNEDVFLYDDKNKIKGVNWEYWKSLQRKEIDFNILFDEAHNKFTARRAMSTLNVTFMKWQSQIRHILGTNETTDFIQISQDLEGIDVVARRLAGQVIYVQKLESDKLVKTKCLQNGRYKILKRPKTYILHYHFFTDIGMKASEKFRIFAENKGALKTYAYRTYYYANPYFQYNDSYNLIDNDSDDKGDWL